MDDSRLSITDEEFQRLRHFIHTHTGIALSDHKRALVCSRLAKRLRYHDLLHYAEYYHLLTEEDPDGQELVAMINAITTNVTSFFRENHHFEQLASRMLPEAMARNATSRRLRIWSAG